MWQLAVLWSVIPDWLITVLVNGLIIVGLVGISASWIARWVPYFNLYRGPIQLIGIACLVLGVYFKGGADVERSWRERIQELEAQIAVAEKQSTEANKRLSDQLQQNKKLTQEVKNANQASIRANAEKINAECRVPDVAIELLNSASQNKVSRSSSGTTGALPAPSTSQPSRPSTK
jgi:preprotein translocase subunit SecF